MRLISPAGVRIHVSDVKGERLKAQGFVEPSSEKAAAPAPARRPRRSPPK